VELHKLRGNSTGSTVLSTETESSASISRRCGSFAFIGLSFALSQLMRKAILKRVKTAAESQAKVWVEFDAISIGFQSSPESDFNGFVRSLFRSPEETNADVSSNRFRDEQ
jgi:hypothetical protein